MGIELDTEILKTYVRQAEKPPPGNVNPGGGFAVGS